MNPLRVHIGGRRFDVFPSVLPGAHSCVRGLNGAGILPRPHCVGRRLGVDGRIGNEPPAEPTLTKVTIAIFHQTVLAPFRVHNEWPSARRRRVDR